MNDKINFYKIYSNCKRGMLELDIVLINFLELEYCNLNKNYLEKLNKLLSNSDQDLHTWLIKGELCIDRNLNDIIIKIRKSMEITKFT